MYSGYHKNEAFRLISEGFCIECGHSKSFAVKRKRLDRAGELILDMLYHIMIDIF